MLIHSVYDVFYVQNQSQLNIGLQLLSLCTKKYLQYIQSLIEGLFVHYIIILYNSN